MKKIFVSETASTNSFIIEALRAGEHFEDETVVYTLRQSAGRGQIGNSWESEFDKNICFSIFLRPTFLPIKEQFLLSEIISLAVRDALFESQPTIKWPNDIYINNEKTCGILIENSLMGSEISYSVLGVGININQTTWIGNAPNPTSLKLCTGRDFVIEEVFDKVLESFEKYYALLKTGGKDEIHKRYIAHLYRHDGFYPYQDTETGKTFFAIIKDVEPNGFLILEDSDGSTHRYMFKEVKFIL